MVKDPVCGMAVNPRTTTLHVEHGGGRHFFCAGSCRERFKADPEGFLSGKNPQGMAPGEATPVTLVRRPPAAPADPRTYTCPMHPGGAAGRDRGAARSAGWPWSPWRCRRPRTRGRTPSSGHEPPAPGECRPHGPAPGGLAMGHMVPGDPVGRLLPHGARPWLELLLATPVVLWGGAPFFTRGWASIVNRSPNMFTLIALGTGVAYAYSLVAVLFPSCFPPSFRNEHGEVGLYFEAAAVIVTLVLLGQVLELRARQRTGAALRALLDLAPRDRSAPAAGWRRRRRTPRGRPSRRPRARAAGGKGPRGRRGRGGLVGRGRVDGDRRVDAGGEGTRRPRHRRHPEHDRRLRDGGAAGGRRHGAGPDRAHGLRGPAQPRPHPAGRRPGGRLVRARGGPDRGRDVCGLGAAGDPLRGSPTRW